MNPADMPSREAMQGLLAPPPVPFWPATPAWAALLLLLLALIGWLAWRGWRAWRRDAYRREALRALAGAGPAAIAAILKRTALAAWPRERVAALSGSGLAAFLRRSAPRAGLDAATAAALAALAHAPAAAATPGLRDAAARWIRRHDPRL